MKRLMVVATVALLASAAPAAGAGKAREVTHDYRMSNGAFVDHGEAHWTLGAAYAPFRAVGGERFVSLAIEDAAGQPVRGHVHIDQDNDGKLDDQLDFCGSTAKPIALERGARIEVGTIVGLCDDSSPSIVTEGTITATFTR
jgi:hypothetical protein